MKKWILPALAAVAAVAAVLVVVNPWSKTTTAEASSNTVSTTTTKDGEILLTSAGLTSDSVSFIRPMEDSKIELLARLGDDGNVKVALGTCQSCNGSPKAYYTQNGDVLQCNNCGLTFPLNVLDQPGGGCHPIMLDESVYTTTEEGVVLNQEALLQYESLFAAVEEHTV